MAKISITQVGGIGSLSGTSAVRPARRLVEIAVGAPDHATPSINVVRLLGRWKARLRPAPQARDLGRLDVDGDAATIYIKTNVSFVRQRFTIAHELGHLLLLRVEGVSLQAQHDDRGFERYCNAFASHLLVPRPWVESEFSDMPRDLDTASEVARQASCSVSAAVAALNDSIPSWQAVFVTWTRATYDRDRWYPLSFFGPRDCRFRIEATTETSDALTRLASAPRDTPQVVLPVRVDGRERDWPVHLRVGKQTISAFSATPTALRGP